MLHAHYRFSLILNYSPTDRYSNPPSLLASANTGIARLSRITFGCVSTISNNRGGLKGSVQHRLAVYPPEFQIPMFFVAVD